MALPAIDALVAAWPETTFDVFVGGHSRVVFAFRPALNIRPIPDALDLQSALLLARRLRQDAYDAVIVLDRSRWLRMAARLSRVPLIAWARSVTPELRHESEVYLDIVREIGVPTPSNTPWVSPRPDFEQLASELLTDVPLPYAVLHPGGAQNPGVAMLDKRWPELHFVELTRTLEQDGVAVVFSGGPGDVEIATRVANQANAPASRVLAGRADIATMSALLNRAALYVGPDTGVSHIAAAVGVPTIAIFGPTNPRRYRPIGRHVQVLAPPASWQIPDSDLRRQSAILMDASTESITLDEVLAAARDALSLGHGIRRCNG